MKNVVNLSVPTDNLIGNPSWLDEFLKSAISPEVALDNVRWVDGPLAIEDFLEGSIAKIQRVTEYPTVKAVEWMRNYAFLEDGAWMVDGLREVPYAKPINPRFDESRKRVRKYETPPGMPATPVMPNIGLRVNGGWDAVLADKSIPLVLTEGVKKALALIEQGIPAIALRGVTQWHEKESKEIWPELAALVEGRQTLVAFDQDEKTKTKADVSRQAVLLGNAIERAGGSPRFMVWDGAMGKGIDDVLAALEPHQRSQWLRECIGAALTPKSYKRIGTLTQAKFVLQAKAPTPNRQTTGEYLPPLPPLEPGINVLSATMNSGKTHRMGKDWVAPWQAMGGITVVLSPLNSLGQQTGIDWKLPHIHDYFTDVDSQNALRADIRHRGGIVACLNSAHRVLNLIPEDRPLLLILDEAAQTLTDAVEGGTLQGEWAARWEDTIALMGRAAHIVLSEDGIDSDTVNLVKSLSEMGSVSTIAHTKTLEPWETTLYRGTPISAFRGSLLAALEGGERILLVTTSQAEARRLERAAMGKGIKTERIDSTTNEGGRYRGFFENPDRWLQEAQPQLCILTTSGKTGLSIEGGVSTESAYFTRVWGYFPNLDTDTHKQLLGRYRPSVPRVVWVPAYITPEPGEGPKAWGIERDLDRDAEQFIAAGKIERGEKDSHDQALKRYLAARRQRKWAQKIQAADALADALRASGHHVEIISGGQKDEVTAALWNEIKETLAREDSAYHAGLEIIPDLHTWEWAKKLSQSVDSTYAQRCLAMKVRMRCRFPGIDWNDPEIWYQAVFCPAQNGQVSSRPVAQGAALWAESESARDLLIEDLKGAEKILSERLKAIHLLPTQGKQAALAATFRKDVEQILQAGETSPTGAAESRIKANALKFRAELKKCWRIEIDATQSATAIANKICRKFGLVLERIRRVRIDGQRQWVYSLKSTPTWEALVAARGQALGSGTDLLEGGINKFVPTPPTPDDGGGGQAPNLATWDGNSPPDDGKTAAA